MSDTGNFLKVESDARAGKWLHNMSTPPKYTIDYHSSERRIGFLGLVYTMPSGSWEPCPQSLAEALGIFPENGNWEEAERILSEQVEEKAGELPLGDLALVTDRKVKSDHVIRDLLSVITVLSKSSDRIYLRRKPPNFFVVKPGRRVVVVAKQVNSGRVIQ